VSQNQPAQNRAGVIKGLGGCGHNSDAAAMAMLVEAEQKTREPPKIRRSREGGNPVKLKEPLVHEKHERHETSQNLAPI